MKKIFTRLFAVLLLSLVSASAWAQLTELEVGKVYRFVSARADRSLAADGTDDVHVKETNAADTKQEWYVTKDGDYYVLRNVACGKYLKGAYSANTPWSMTDDYSDEYNKFGLYTSNSTLNTLKTKGSDGYGYMHDDNNGDNGGYNVVGWLNGDGNTGTHWTITKVDYTAEQITALLEKAPTTAELAGYTTALEAIFSDVACTILKSAYTTTSMTDEQLAADANYSALPQALKNMVKKVRNDEWSEATIAPASRPNGNNNDNHNLWTVEDTWGHEYAKKFRVQMYEPYSVEGEITSYLRINAHCNMDNPTGIYANAGEPIYIMVEGDIAEGAELWVAHQTGHGVTNYYNNAAYTQLKKGLNVIPYASDGCQLWINYLVHTYDADGATIQDKFPHKLSEYKPLKIHIEGGHINGFFNAMGDFRSTEVTGDANGGENLWGDVDNDEDWNYYKARAALSGDFALLGHRQTLLFPFGAWDSTNGYFGVANNDGGIEKALAWHLENITVPATPNCYAGSGKAFGNYSDTYYPGMQLSATTGKINIMLEAWDRIQYSEHASLGLLSVANIEKMNALYPRWTTAGEAAEIYNYGEATINNVTQTYQQFCQGIDYSDYYNHHGAAVGSGSGYMSGGWRVCNYHYNTMGSIIGKIAAEAGPTWGPAHEIGHQHQTIFNLNGQTEVTNNFHSNVAVWYMGMGTSRVNGSNGSLESVLGAFNTDGNDLYTNNIWAITHLYYRLWLYYHLAGNNTQFWPRLFELLRQVPIVNGAQISGETSLLRFYQHACDAAGEDLTEFFRAHGFFEIMDNRFVGDYSNATYNVTQEQIDAAIKSVKDKGYPVNYAVLLINDATSETTLKHDGTTKRALWDTNASAEYGSVSDFINGNVSVETTYTATLNSDGTLTMSGGEGGVGFLVLNEDGEIVSFSNKSTFAISGEAAYLLATGKASVVTVDTESTTTEAEVDVTAMRFALLQELIENANTVVANVDETQTRVGFYKPSAVENLQEYVTMAQEVIANGDLANLQAVYELLYAEYNAVVANEFSRVPLVPGSKYAILAKTNDRRLSFSDTNVVTVANTEDYASTANNQWYVERDGAFHIKNAGNNKYIQNVTDQNGVLYTVGDEVVNMNINEIQLGCYSIATSTVPGRYMNMDGGNNARVITWGDTGNNSQWKFILLEENETNAAKEDLLELAKKTLALVDVVGTVEYTEGNKIELQSTNSGNANYIWSNAAVSGNDVDKLLDSDKNTFFHSQWNNSTAPADGWGHHISVDLGTSSTLTSFKFKFTTRNQSNLSNYPKTIEVYGSNVGGNDVANYTKLQAASGFATGAGVDNEVVVMGNGTAYRYLRFLVTDASGSNAGTNTGADGKVFFHMSEFSLYPITVTTSVKSDYTSGVTSDAVMNAFVDAEQAKSVYNNASATIDDINAKKTALGDGTAAGSYTTLLAQYNNVLNSVLEAKKEQLQDLIDETETLIASVGSVTIVPPTENELSLQVDNANGPYYLSTNSQESGDNRNIKKLIDGVTDNADSYFHTDWQTSVGADHHLLLDMGADNTLGTFAFKYTTRNNSAGIDAPTSMVVEGSNDNSSFTTIATLAGLPTGQHATYESSSLGNGDNKYRYIRFRVTGGAGRVGDYYYFAMSEFDVTELTETEITVTNNSSVVEDDMLVDTYLATAKSQKLHDTATTVALLDAAIADQQAAKDALEKAKNTPADLDKTALQSLYDDALELYGEMADTEGNVKAYYESSALTNEKLAEAKTALDAAKTVLDSSNSQTEIDAAKTTLQEQYDALLEIKNSDFTGRDELNALIGDMQSLLGEVADKTAAKTAIALQVDDEEREFYIWSNATANDCDGIGALIDKNDDASAKTGTFFGTVWQGGAVANYSHYITVDLGIEIALSELSIDYTTRNSTHANQRPTSIKILGSNDKEGEYAEITHLSEGMPVGQCAKWEMDGTVALNGYYRYIRFAVATEKGYFNMSDFNLYAHSALVTNSNYQPADITGAQLFAMNAALLAGIDARDKFVTEENYNVAVTALQAQYDALLAIKNANKTDKDELETLVTETNELVTEVATVNDTETSITMQCTDENASYYLYCNAPGKTNNYAGDDKGVTALLDNDSGTFLHTTYNGNDYADDLDHYLRLDMGENEALAAFKFNYVGRVGNTGNAPKTIVVEGSNDRENFEEITTLKNLPTADNATYQSGEITNGKAYRYVRFIVTATVNNDMYNGHPFFAMSHFEMTACKTISVAQEYASPNLPLSVVVAANNEAVDGTTVKEQFYVTQDLYDSTVAELQAAKDALAAAIALKNIPVKLTTDVNNPVLYKIRINRSALKVLGIDDSDAKVPVEDFVRDDDTQSWYFMQGTDDESYEDIHIFPYWYNGAANTTLRLGASSTGDASAAVVAVESTDATNTIQNWYITRASGTEEGWWNIQPEGKTNYFSNNGGITNKMGFWNSASDNGSEFQFLLDGPYTDLSIIFGSVVAREPEYNAPGYYANAADYNAVYDIASGYVTNANGTDEQYTAALDNLIGAETALSDGGRVPSDALEDGAVYRIMNLITNTTGEKYHYIANSSAAITFPTAPAEDNSDLWVCKANEDGTYEFVSALGTATLGWDYTIIETNAGAVKENATKFVVDDNASVSGAKRIAESNNSMSLTNELWNSKGEALFNRAGDNNNAQRENWSTDWYFQEVEDADVKFNVNISSRRFSSLYLPYDVEVPEGVSAFTAVNVDGDKVDLYRVADRYDDTAAGSIIPARTPVILYLEDEPFTAGVYTFTYAPSAEALSDAVAEKVDAAIIFGKILQTPIQCDANTRYYKLGGKSGDTVSKMYWMYKEYGSDGTITHPGTDDGGYIRCSANKIYMTVAESVASNSFSMRFGIDIGTTDINEVNGENADVKTIYDLQGRKLNGITDPGMYIVDGKKVYVK